MRIYLQALDLDVCLPIDNGEINDEFDKKARKEIMRGLSNLDIENMIFCKISKDISDKLNYIYEVDMKDTCDVKRISMKAEAVKYSKRVEDHEPYDDSFVSIRNIDDQHQKKIRSTSNLLFCCYYKTIGHLFSNLSASSIGESESFSSSYSGK